MKIRTVLFWMHLVAGVAAGVVILLMSITGVLLTYERQLIEWSDREFRSAPPSTGAERLPLDTLVARVREQRPDSEVTAFTVAADPHKPVLVAAGRGNLYVDGYTGAVLGEPTTGVRQAMSRLRSWHRWIALEGDNRALGKAISGWSNVLFLFVVLSGMYLWLPRTWTFVQVRAVSWFRGGLRGKARDFNWHNVIGIWSAVPLAIVIATAMPISFPWANALVYRLVGEEPPAPAARPGGEAARPTDAAARPASSGNRTADAGSASVNLQALFDRANLHAPGWRSINMRVPVGSGPATFAIDAGTGGQPQHRSTLTLDASSGSVLRWEPFESQSLGRRLRSWTRFTHTGEYYGIAGQTVAGVVSFGAVVLVWTGISLALRRLRQWLSPAARRRDETAKAA